MVISGVSPVNNGRAHEDVLNHEEHEGHEEQNTKSACMGRKPLTFVAVVALSASLSSISIAAQGRVGQRGAKPTVKPQRIEQTEAPDSTQQTRIDFATLVAVRQIEPPVTRLEAFAGATQQEWELWKDRFRRAFAPPYWSQWVLALFAVVGFAVALRTLTQIKQEVVETGRAAKAAEDSATAATNTLLTNREIERAYIAISVAAHALADSKRNAKLSARHRTDDENPDAVELVIEIRNRGKTPGDILGGFCTFTYEPASVGPNFAHAFGGTHLTRLFLLPEDMIDFTVFALLGTDNIAHLRSEDWRPNAEYLWLIAEVDYRDRFQKVHRYGYCRRYDKDAAGFVLARRLVASTTTDR